MKTVRLGAAVLLALALIVFGGNYFVDVIPLPEPGESAGESAAGVDARRRA